MITKQQYNEALEIRHWQMSLKYWEREKKGHEGSEEYQKNAALIIEDAKGRLMKLTGSGRGFLDE
jgi:hypothetical protein